MYDACMHIRLTLNGVGSLIVQSDRSVNLLDPLNRELRALAKRRQRTDEDIEEMARLEFYLALYYDPKIGPYLPGDNIQASLRRGGAFAGRLGKMVERAVVVTSDVNPIEYEGPRDIAALWKDPFFRLTRSVVVQRARVMRTRPIFRKWRTTVELELATDLLNLDDFRRVADAAGTMEGIGTWRPRYGRYEVKVAA